MAIHPPDEWMATGCTVDRGHFPAPVNIWPTAGSELLTFNSGREYLAITSGRDRGQLATQRRLAPPAV